jgi:hypothetical protein
MELGHAVDAKTTGWLYLPLAIGKSDNQTKRNPSTQNCHFIAI